MPNPTIPHLRKTPKSAQLIVDGEPFLMLPAELHNSSLSSAKFMAPIWPKLKQMSINTALGSVTWSIIEPREGEFDFSELDACIAGARKHGLRLVLLWFGSYKNAMSTYVPDWVKTDVKRFPRVHISEAGAKTRTLELLSPFNERGMEADGKAFGELMKHLREYDQGHNTVVMVQVENETGLLGDSRDRSKVANTLFEGPVPTEFLEQLQSTYKQKKIHPAFAKRFPDLLNHITGKVSWRDVFGGTDSTFADEMFMSWAFSRYVGYVAAAGKAEHPLPFYTNVWLNINDPSALDLKGIPIVVGGGAKPGVYPSGGPCPHTFDTWKLNAPALDFISPDVYIHDYEQTCRDYTHNDQPLFIPEQRRDESGARRVWVAYGTYHALGSSPFGIDSLSPSESPIAKHFKLLDSIKSILLRAQAERPDEVFGFFFDAPEEGEAIEPTWTKTFPSAEMSITITRAFVLGKPGPGAGLIIHHGSNRYLLVGWGFSVAFKSTKKTASWSGILRVDEKEVDEQGELRTMRSISGDETKHGDCMIMANEDPDYAGFPVAITPPCNTMIAEVVAYCLEEDSEDY